MLLDRWARAFAHRRRRTSRPTFPLSHANMQRSLARAQCARRSLHAAPVHPLAAYSALHGLLFECYKAKMKRFGWVLHIITFCLHLTYSILLTQLTVPFALDQRWAGVGDTPQSGANQDLVWVLLVVSGFVAFPSTFLLVQSFLKLAKQYNLGSGLVEDFCPESGEGESSEEGEESE